MVICSVCGEKKHRTIFHNFKIENTKLKVSLISDVKVTECHQYNHCANITHWSRLLRQLRLPLRILRHNLRESLHLKKIVIFVVFFF